MEMILGRLESGKAIKGNSLVPEIVVRESTAIAPKL